MIQHAHEKFRRWALWVLAPVPGHDLGYGKNVLQRIREGRGQILPGAPRGSRPPIPSDPVALQVDGFVKTLPKEERRLIRTFYLDRSRTVEDRAESLGLPVRTMYDRLDRIQRRLLEYLEM